MVGGRVLPGQVLAGQECCRGFLGEDLGVDIDVWGSVMRAFVCPREGVIEFVSLYVRTIFWISEVIEAAVSGIISANGAYTVTWENQTVFCQQVIDVEG